MTKKHKKVCTTLNQIEHLLILASTVTGCASISAFVFLVGIPALRLKICAITAGIEKYKSIIKKRRVHDKIVFLAKTKSNTMEVLISKALIDPCISHDEFISINNVLKEYNDMKKDIGSLKTSASFGTSHTTVNQRF